MINPPEFSIIPNHLNVIEENLEKLEKTDPKMASPELFKEVLESFKALGEMNLSEIERKKLHVVYQKLSSLQKRVEGVFDKHVMTKVEKQLAHFDADTRLRNLEEAFKNEKGFSDRWDAHMKIVELRLKKSEKDLTPKNKYEELD